MRTAKPVMQDAGSRAQHSFMQRAQGGQAIHVGGLAAAVHSGGGEQAWMQGEGLGLNPEGCQSGAPVRQVFS